MLLVNLTVLGGAVWLLKAPPVTAVRILPPPTGTPAPAATAVRLQVYVSGAVATQDVVRLAAGARVRDAVAAAGGFSPAADRAAVNLAAPVADGAHVHVPAVGESVRLEGAPEVPNAGGAGAEAAPGASLGLNSASAAQLEALPGIGPALAERIVRYRADHGPFHAVKDLEAVPGVGAKTLARFADRLTVP
jgi:competence protein ComEA